MTDRRQFLRRFGLALVGAAIAKEARLPQKFFQLGAMGQIRGNYQAFKKFEYERIYGKIAEALATKAPYVDVFEAGHYRGIGISLDDNPLRVEWMPAEEAIGDHGHYQIGRLWYPSSLLSSTNVAVALA